MSRFGIWEYKDANLKAMEEIMNMSKKSFIIPI
jgi:hypothetical protein